MASVDVRDGVVTAVSGQRLPFEPRGELREFRDRLRVALKQLTAARGHGLVACYATPDQEFADVENVALYNVGSGAYSHLIAAGVTCSRTPSPDQRHHLTYRVAALDEPWPPATQPVLATAGPITVPAATPGPGGWWALFRDTLQLSEVAARLGCGVFAVDVTLTGAWSEPSVAAAVKPLLDGLISALASHDGTRAGDLLPRLAELGAPEEVWERLCDQARAPLGVRPLIRPHGPRIAWNPPDDRCQSFRVRVTDADAPRTAAARVISL